MKASIFLKYENKWVALNKDRSKVLFAAKSLETLHKILEKAREKDIILHYVPHFDRYYSL